MNSKQRTKNHNYYNKQDSPLGIIPFEELSNFSDWQDFDHRLAQEIILTKEKGQGLGLMLLDIERLKYINGYLGYELGDQLLYQISQRLQSIMTDKSFFCRYSSDQFAFVFPLGDQLHIYEKKAKDILKLFESPFIVENNILDISVMLGISIYCSLNPQESLEVEELIKFAHIALLRCKSSGKKRYEFYSPELDQKSHKLFLLRNDMHKALAEEQFQIYYQPLVDLYTKEILALEALLRWDHPRYGMISPSDFIPIMEETGFIKKVGKWVLAEVCRHHSQWRSEGFPPTKISVNCSSVQFTEDHFVENIQDILNTYQMDPRFLILEITENLILDNDRKVIADIQRLQEMGILIAVDDFGTGYSSLSYLDSFKVDVIKIDSSFIQKAPTNKTSAIITRSIIELAHELGIKLVAEGIETPEQLAYLQMFKCYAGQGFLFSKPVTQQEVKQILANNKCS